MVDGQCEAVGAGGGHHPLGTVLGGEFGFARFVLEVPHERGGIEETDGGYAEWFTQMRERGHSFRVTRRGGENRGQGNRD